PGFPPGAYLAPIELDDGWGDKTITAALNGPDPALWVRDDSDGWLALDTGSATDGVPPGGSGGSMAYYDNSGFPASTVPVLASADVNHDGRPDLYGNTRRTEIDTYLNIGDELGAPVSSPLSNTGLLRNGTAGMCLDDFHGLAANGNEIWLWPCNAGPQSQMFTMYDDGTVRVNGSCLDASGYGTANGTKVWLYTC